MLSDIWSATDRIFCHYGPFFFFYPPSPPPPPIPQMDPENQNFEKMKKKLENTIILQMFTINYSHIIYGFSDTECNRQNFVILDHFLHF